MAIGYQGIVFINKNQFLVTSADLNNDRPRLDSDTPFAATGLGGRSSPVGKVHLYDLSSVGMNFHIEANTYLIDELFDGAADNVPGDETDLDTIVDILDTKTNCGGWIENRHNPRSVLWYNNSEWSFTYGKAFWTTLSLAANDGELVTSDIALDVIVDATSSSTDVDFGGSYVTQKFGIPNTLSPDLGPGGGYLMPDYSPWSLGADKSHRPLPYWATMIETTPALPSGVEIKSWNLSVTNNVQKKHACLGTSGNHPGPRWVTIGTMDVSFSMTLVSARLNETVYLPNRFSQVDIVLGDSVMHGSARRIRMQNVENTRDTLAISPGEIQQLNYDTGAFFRKPVLVV